MPNVCGGPAQDLGGGCVLELAACGRAGQLRRSVAAVSVVVVMLSALAEPEELQPRTRGCRRGTPRRRASAAGGPEVLVAAVRAVERDRALGAAGAHRRSSSSARPDPLRRTARRRRAARRMRVTPLDVVGQLLGRHLAGRAACGRSRRRSAERAAEVHLEALDLLAGLVDQLALEADVGDLDAGARVGAAVDVDGDRLVEVGSRRSSSSIRCAARAFVSTIASLQNSMPVQAIVPRRNVLGRDVQAERLQPVDQRLDLVRGDVEHDQLLLDGQPDPAQPAASARSATWPSSVAVDAADGGRDADVEAPSCCGCTPTWSRRPCGGGGGAGPSVSVRRGTRPPAPRGTSRRPSRRRGTSGGRGVRSRR